MLPAMQPYDHKKIETKWQEKWLAAKQHVATETNDAAKKYYLLVEFPYPSGNLHVGHWYAFAIPDMLARYLRMQGKHVLFPIGFDAFGLPAENAAIKRKLNPRLWTYDNIAYMRKQLQAMGASYDWDREVITADPAYYTWTQWLFLQLFKNKLAFQAVTPVNWCPSCKTVLANEQVVNGACERCDSPIERRDMLQWNIKITDYADRLVDDLDALNWPEQIKDAQRNWIGRSLGAKLTFKLIDVPGQEDFKHGVEVFTTRPDTLFGATFIAISPELAKRWIDMGWQVSDDVKSYITETLSARVALKYGEVAEKTGIPTGLFAINPANKVRIPVWIANYVLGDVGTGAIMAVPAHDERDYAFAVQYQLPVIPVVAGKHTELPYSGDGTLINSGKFNDLTNTEAKEKITAFVKAEVAKTYRLRDWVISRQRYWGVPIPIIHCNVCGPVAVPDDELPVLLPEIEDYLPTGDGKSPLAKVRTWVEVPCPKCKAPGERESDTFDTFVDSSWYFLRYTDPKNDTAFAAKEKMAQWMPIDLYSGGSEHTTMHVLYSRFWQKALFDLGLVKDSEPYLRRMNRGLIMGPDGQKMSKSKGNVIDPDDVVGRLGADTVRMYLAFIGPYNQTGSYPWSPDGIVGVRRFLERIWLLNEKLSETLSLEVDVALHKLIQKVSEDIPALKFNTSVAAFMSFLNVVQEKGITAAQYDVLLVLLAPFVPHMTEELWQIRGHTGSIHTELWPAYDPTKLITSQQTIIIQINGKRRSEYEALVSATEEDVRQSVVALPEVKKWIDGKEIERVIYVPGRLVNIVVRAAGSGS